MAERGERMSEVWKGARRGVGWALGVGTVVAVGEVLAHGPRPAMKRAIKRALHARAVAAELGERAQDVYAEAASEYERQLPEATQE
jgi:hypothetical protein